jgi:hypothetical protein
MKEDSAAGNYIDRVEQCVCSSLRYSTPLEREYHKYLLGEASKIWEVGTGSRGEDIFRSGHFKRFIYSPRWLVYVHRNWY